jgi:serine/threonine-protein kinase RsbT
MASHEDETLPISSENEVVAVRQRVRARAAELGFPPLDQTKLVTAASELARNVLVHGGGGTVRIQAVRQGPRQALKLVFEDHGPGILDVTAALEDGYSTTGGLGLGLGGAKRLCSEFEIESAPGAGTCVTILRWK